MTTAYGHCRCEAELYLRCSCRLQERAELQQTLHEERANNTAERQRLQSATTAAEQLAQQSTGQVGFAAAPDAASTNQGTLLVHAALTLI